ncbi:MAG: DUF2191 domain-containing protein [Comamonadaceae bacterium]|nr:DUF2191 domain-containing protein [Comamonadaceae bacterium]
MKTSLDIQDSLLAEARALAARQGLSLTRVVEQALRLRLDQAAAATPARRAAPVFRDGTGLAPGLDATCTRHWLDAGAPVHDTPETR